MKKEERDVIYSKYIAEGMSERQAWKAVNQLDFSQKVIFKDKEKEIRQLNKKIEILEKKLEKATGRSKDFKTQFLKDTKTEEKVKEIKTSKNDEATIKDLNRVISIVDMEGKIGLSDLTRTCIIKPKTMKGILNFLIRNKFLREIKTGTVLMLEKI